MPCAWAAQENESYNKSQIRSENNTHDGSQDKEGSDSMEPALDAMRMSGLMRRGVALVRGLEIKQVGRIPIPAVTVTPPSSSV